MYDPITMKLNVDPYILSALKEDITSEDVSTNSVMPHPQPGEVDLICKEDGIICGLQVFARVFTLLDEKTTVAFYVEDGEAVKKGQRGDPGELRGDFTVQRDVGTLTANTNGGIFGKVADAGFIDATQALPVAQAREVKCGPATILSTVSGHETREYQVEILRLYGSGHDTRNLLLKVTDPQLLEATGGIVQGMSGSPILQNGKLVGAVTHVMVNDPAQGYGIFAENMLVRAG